jgi:predicted DNA-binding transcriptional regulator YafY
MNFIKQIERIQKVNHLIRLQRTGTPEELASKLGVSKRQLYNVLDFLKENGASLVYSRERQTFYYREKDFNMEIVFSIRPLVKDEIHETTGGFSSVVYSVQF